MPAVYITHSDCKSEIDIMQDRLERYMETGKSVDLDSSLAFLYDTTTSKSKSLHDTKADSPNNFYSVSQETFEGDVGPPSAHFAATSNVTATENLERKADKIIKLLTAIRDEMLRTWKATVKISKQKTTPSDPAPVASVSAVVDGREPVIHEGTDLVKVGRSNLHIGAYGTTIARILWSDQELKESRLLPLRRKGRASLFPERTRKWMQAVKSRFNIEMDDADELRPAVNAVNQLGLDLKCNKRSR